MTFRECTTSELKPFDYGYTWATLYYSKLVYLFGDYLSMRHTNLSIFYSILEITLWKWPECNETLRLRIDWSHTILCMNLGPLSTTPVFYTTVGLEPFYVAHPPPSLQQTHQVVAELRFNRSLNPPGQCIQCRGRSYTVQDGETQISPMLKPSTVLLITFRLIPPP